MTPSTLYWKWDKAIPELVCEALISEMESWQLETAEISKQPGSFERTTDIDQRKSNVAFLPYNHWFEGIMFNHIRYANRATGWNYDITGTEPMQYTVYGNGGIYDWHSDQEMYNISPIMRKLSCVCQLNKSSEFTGGGLYYKDLMGDESKESLLIEQGDIVVMPSYILHRAAQITSGKRITMVLWSEGPAYK
jgi:PKHD-type hydroxylase